MVAGVSGSRCIGTMSVRFVLIGAACATIACLNVAAVPCGEAFCSEGRVCFDASRLPGAPAEHESHHPEIVTSHVEQPSAIGWGRVTVTWATMIIEALHRNDFVMAAKTDRLYAEAADKWQ